MSTESSSASPSAPASAASDMRFRGKTIVITGAGGTFGRAGCLYFAARGARVAALDNNFDALSETVRLVREECHASAQPYVNKHINGFECDVTSTESVDAAVRDVVKAFGSIHLLWNNAGYQGQIKPTLEYSVADFATVLSVNVTGMFAVMQAVAKVMAKSFAEETKSKEKAEVASSHPFAIVNTASVAGMRGTPAMVAYSSSKAAVLAMTVSSAKDLAPHGIRVNAVSPALIGPGFMWTRQNELHASSGSPYFSTDPEEVAKNKVGGVPMKRLGTTDEVINAVAFLLSDDSSYTTAFNLVIDGGMSGGLR
jgi:NAD(P)-dependent dehydrogenase (short-subunit alcohol dehydrogenase family)